MLFVISSFPSFPVTFIMSDIKIKTKMSNNTILDCSLKKKKVKCLLYCAKNVKEHAQNILFLYIYIYIYSIFLPEITLLAVTRLISGIFFCTSVCHLAVGKSNQNDCGFENFKKSRLLPTLKGTAGASYHEQGSDGQGDWKRAKRVHHDEAEIATHTHTHTHTHRTLTLAQRTSTH